MPDAPAGTIKADTGARILAYLIDLVIAIPITLIGLIPIVGQFIAVMLLLPYWLLRDFGGASIGKRIFGLRVVDYNGNIAPLGKRIKRNLLFGLSVLLLAIPFFGEFIFPIAFLIVSLVEVVLMANRGERMGDRDAKSLVVKRTTSTAPTFISPPTSLQ